MPPSSDERTPPRSASGQLVSPSDSVRVRFDGFDLDEANALLAYQGRPVALAPTPFAVLCTLVRQPGALVGKNELLDAVWGHRFVSESVLKTAISEVRAALGDAARRPRYIETVSRRGYRFVGVAIPIAGTAAAAGSRSPPTSVSCVGAEAAPPLVGRAAALKQLVAAWQAATAGRRCLVWVVGDPGIGKTTLIDHFVSTLADAATARGQCVEQFGSAEPYLPVLEAIAELARRDASVPALLREVAPAWLLELPWLSPPEEREALRRELAGARPERMLRELGELLDRYTQQRPLLLVTEDLHWSDRATLQLIDHITRRRSPARLLWLASFRLADVVAHDHPVKALRTELRLHGLCQEIVLDPFSEQEVAACVALRAPAIAADESFVRVLHERTDGLPLLVTHLMGELAAPGREADRRAWAQQVAGLAIPDSWAGVMERYVARLTAEQRALLDVAAVSGVEFRVTTAAAALERDASSVAALCEEFARGQLWLYAARDDATAGASYRFRHALLRQWLYERIGPVARARSHAAVGAALQRERRAGVPVAAAELATHFERAGETLAALGHYADAAQAALRLSPAEALALADHGLGLIARAVHDEARYALEITLRTLRGLALAHVAGATSTEARDTLQRAYVLLTRVPRHPMRGLLVHELGLMLALRGEYAAALEIAERTSALAESQNDAVLLLGVGTVRAELHMLRGRPRDAREWLERLLANCEPLERDPAEPLTDVADPLVTPLGLLAIQLLHLGYVGEARRRLREARTRARELAQPRLIGWVLWFEAMIEVRLGNPARVAELAEEMQTVVDDFAFAHGEVACRWFRGWAKAQLGDPRGGYELLAQAYDENTRLGMMAGASEILGFGAEALVRAGDWLAARAQLNRALDVARALGERVYLPQLKLIEAELAQASGEHGAARDAILGAINEAREQEAVWLEFGACLALCTRDDATADDRRQLSELVSRLPDAAETPAVSRARALLLQHRD